MKKLLVPFLLLFILILSACGNNSSEENTEETNNPAEGASETTEDTSESTENESSETEAEEETSGTITYESENGPVEVPADPQRVVVLSSYAGNVMALDVPIVGVDAWSMGNPLYEEKLEGVEEVSEENLEKIIELNPDLIIGLASTKNLDKISEIAPTVTFTWGSHDYLTQHLEIGKVLNKEEEAQAWIDDYKQRAQALGEEVKAEIGKDATVTVIENFNKDLYVFGDNWARGTELLYQEMKLNMPEKVKETALEPGYYTLSLEVLPEFVGDYLIVSKTETDTSFLESETYKNIPAVKNNQVFVADATKFYFSDPLTLEYQLEFFRENFLGN
ncbi:iron-hydroxamate ABC transporter substrate-binding protein [Aquibacillus albus]|uniref:Iron complex transport system substrate-binding protein n=1 Tax=Aquibacillus albus TaxID=1168171 RepID=A0ABS2N3R2_9BACI|nr:iron-hydroxamate ABC transporter substrate-binding protein [Aquibacillus albus]MBM7572762.1 iron complex transport system substrate-binding protein [Aquibacillus albus]